MKRSLALSSVLLVALCFPGCGDSPDRLTKESISTMKELATTLDGVRDTASAKATKPKIKALAERMNKINERQGKLKPPTEAEMKAVEAKYGKEMAEAQQKLGQQIMRIAFNPTLGAELNDIDFQGR